jgi:hypothetical protein
MKTRFLVILSIVLAVCMTVVMAVPPAAAAELPPAMPSGFYGTVTGVRVGQVVNVVIGAKVLACTKTYNAPGYGIVYSLDVNMDKFAEGTAVAFKISGKIVAYAALHSGTNQHVDLVRGKIPLSK